MAEIPLRNRAGEIVAKAIVDEADVVDLQRFRWRLSHRGYPERTRRISERQGATCSTLQMGRQLLGLEHGDPRQVDHINRNPLDNRRANLRVATSAHNIQNRSHPGGSSPHRGVTWHRSAGKWQAAVGIGRKSHYLGLFTDELEAANAAATFRQASHPQRRAYGRHVLKGKRFASCAARLRGFYWVVLRRWETEVCTECGRPVRLVWWCHDDRLWELVTGNAKTPGSREAAAGIWCIYYFDAAAKRHVDWLEWAPLNLRHLGGGRER